MQNLSDFREVQGAFRKQSPLVLDCDIGFDSDDYWALYLLYCSGSLKAVVTTLYEPGQKKKRLLKPL